MCGTDKGVAVAVIDLNQLAREYGARADAVRDWAPAMEGVARLIEVDQAERFAAGVGPDFSPWPVVRFPAVPGNPPLIGRTRSLAASFTAGGPGHVREVTADSATVGSRHPLAAVQSRGATISVPERRRGRGEKPWAWRATDGAVVVTSRIRAHTKRIPARELGGVSEAALVRIRNVLGEYLRRGSVTEGAA